MLGLSPKSGAGSCAGLPARFWPRSARPGVGGRTPPSAPATHSRSRKTTGAGLPPASLPGGSPTSSTLAGEEGFMQRARARARRAESGPVGGGDGGRSLPEPTAPGTAAWSRGDRWAVQSPAAAAGRHPGPRPPARRALRLQHPERRAARLQDSGSPSASQLSSSRVLPCSPVLRADARTAMAVPAYPLQNEGKSTAGER